MKTFSEAKKELLNDPQVKKEYLALNSEYELITQIIELRTKKGLSQSQLAELVGTKQSAISRLESGSYNPTILMLKKISQALDSTLRISIS